MTAQNGEVHPHEGTNRHKSPYYGALQDIVDSLFDGRETEDANQTVSTVRRLDVVLSAEAADLPDDLVSIVKLLPPGDYTRERLCFQLNSAINGHAWGQVYGTVV